MMTADAIRIGHMLEAAREAIQFAHGRTRDDLEQDRVLALALVKLIEIIGEAAGRVSSATQVAHPEVPWPQIVGMRNHLVHAYFSIDLDRLWDTIVDDLPPFVEQLQGLAATDTPEPS